MHFQKLNRKYFRSYIVMWTEMLLHSSEQQRCCLTLGCGSTDLTVLGPHCQNLGLIFPSTESGRFDTGRSRFDTNLLPTSSCFDTVYCTIYKWPNEPSKTCSLERTQTSVVNKTDPCLREPPHVPKPPMRSFIVTGCYIASRKTQNFGSVDL